MGNYCWAPPSTPPGIATLMRDPLAWRRRLRLACDPSFLFTHCTGKIPLHWQREMLDCVAAAANAPLDDDRIERRLWCNIHRQGGKSLGASTAAAWQAIYGRPGSTVVVTSPSERQSLLLFEKIADTIRQLPSGTCEVTKENMCELEIRVGNRARDIRSRIVGLPGSSATLRGFTSSMVLVDEASRVEPDLWSAISPMLSTTSGVLLLISTPAGCALGNKFYEIHRDKPPGWRMWTVPVTESGAPIGKSFLAQERAELGRLYAIEYLCKFDQGGDGSYFDMQAVEDSINPSIRPLF